MRQTYNFKKLEQYGALRQERNEKMLRLISKNVYNIDKDEFYARFDRSVITRAHFAQYLYEKGIVSSVKEAFDRYLEMESRATFRKKG